jgi:hypothetical protein
MGERLHLVTSSNKVNTARLLLSVSGQQEKFDF